MGKNRVLFPLILVVSLVMLAVLPLQDPIRAASTITVTQPTSGTVIAESGDFAMEEFSDPWDFSQSTDVRYEDIHDITGLTVSGGIVSGQASGNDPNFFVHFPCYYDAQPIGRDGLLHPIDTSQYRYLSIRMYASAGTFTQVFWFYNQFWTSYGNATFFANAGWNTYQINLGAQPGWTGNPIGFRVDPANASGVSFQIDWMKLHRTGTSANQLTIEWTDSSPGGTANIYLDNDNNPDNGNIAFIVSRTSNATNSYVWDASDYPTGTYYIYIEKSGQKAVSPGPFEIRSPALLEILDPDEEGGQDFATAASSDPWDMSQISDLTASYNVSNLGVDGVLHGVNQNDDPNIYLRVPTSIDTNHYHRLTFSMTYDPPFDFGHGTMTRFVWNQYGYYEPTYQTIEDLITYPEWREYTVDLKTAQLDSGNLGWSGTVPVFRFDPLEVPASRWFHVDWIKLCADDEASTSFQIKWQDLRASPPPTTVAIYYDNNDSGYDGTLIDQNINQVSGVNTYTWDVTQVDPGLYYIYIVATDSVTTGRRYSTGPLRISSPPVPRWYVKKSAGAAFDAGTSWATGWGDPGDKPLVGDFDGDGIGDIGIYRPSQSGWFVKRSTGTAFVAGTSWGIYWGNPWTETPLVGDFDGDGKDDIGIYRYGSYPNWFFKLSTGTGFAGTTFPLSWGNPGGDTPLVGDFNGDGKDDIAIYRYGSYPNWFIRIASGSPGNVSWGSTWALSWGNPGGDTPIVGNFNGDKNGSYDIDDIGVYRTGSYPNWFMRMSTGSNLNGATWALPWGNAGGDVPIVGDFTGDGKDDIGIFRITSYPNWFTNTSSGSGFDSSTDSVTSWGNPLTDSPLVADFSGDARDDIGIYRRP